MRRYTSTLVFACLVLSLILPSTSSAQLNCSRDDLLALTFNNGDINKDIAQFTQDEIYIVVLNPTFDALYGMEFGFELPTEILGVAIEINGTAPIDVGQGMGDHIVGLASPTPVTGSQVLLATLTIFQMAATDLEKDIYLKVVGYESIAGCNSVLLANDEIYPMTPITDDYALPAARINPTTNLVYCPEAVAFDLAVSIHSGGDGDNIAATGYGASDGYDSGIDLLDTDSARRVYFPRAGWIAPEEVAFRRDVRAPFDPLTEMKQWSFVVDTPAVASDGEMVYIDFSPDFSNAYALKLVDHTTGLTYSLWPYLSYSYYTTGGVREFDLQLGIPSSTYDPLSVLFTASTSALVDSFNYAGTMIGATDGYDPGLDIPEPGPPPSDYLTASFRHSDWQIGSRYATDMRELYDPTAGPKTWTFTVESDLVDDVFLRFFPDFGPSDGIVLSLQDMTTGQKFNLFPNLVYSYANNGPSTRYFELTIGGEEGVAPDLNPTNRVIPTGWSLIGMPLMPTPGSDLGSVVLDQNPGYGYIYDYPSVAGYRYLTDADAAQFSIGYWLATDTSFNWTMTGDRALSRTLISLDPGWNLVGNPMWFPCPIDGVMVYHSGNVYSWDTAVGLGLVSVLMDYDNATNTYFNTYDLEAWHGYWFRALTTGVSVEFDWPNFQVVPSRLLYQNPKLPGDIPNWKMELSAVVPGDLAPQSITLGVDPEASAGFDPRYDWPAPPASPLGGSRLAVQHPEWKLPGGNAFVADMVNPDTPKMSWNIELFTEHTGNVEFQWDRSDWPAGLDFQLYLPESNRVVVLSMAQEDAITLPVSGGRILIQVRTPDMASPIEDTPAYSWKLGVHPNPFNPMTTIAFELETPCTAEIRIYSVRGELIDTIARSQYAAGGHDVTWRGTDQRGRSVPSGSYFARLIADGSQVGDVVKMSLIR